VAYTGKKIISLDEVQALNLIDAYVPATTLLDSESTIRSTVRVNIGKLGYEARFSYTMEHPFYLELNGIIV